MAAPVVSQERILREVAIQRCVDRACEGGDEDQNQANASEVCRQWHGADFEKFCDPCLLSAVLLALGAATDFGDKVIALSLKEVNDVRAERDVALARAAEAAEYAQNIMVELGPVVADAAIVGHRYGWPEVFGIVMATKRAFYAQQEELSRLRAERTWQPIETHPKRRKVAVTWVNAYGKRQTTYAVYFDAGELDMDDSYDDYDEEGKNIDAGWFEERETGDPGYYELTEPLDFWQPLPSPPGASQE